MSGRDPRRALPSLDRLLRDPGGAALVREWGREATVAALRAELEERRAAGGPAPEPAAHGEEDARAQP
ncbi:MAG: hypothetical protein RRA92_00045, partial [Gemmatimonadota bacterium]|nr:hypothetical protein [Gemmatimonadota bacterium]